MTRTRKVVLNASALIAALLAVVGWALRSSAHAIDERYVHVDAFTAFQAGVERVREADSSRVTNRLQLDSAFMQRILDATCADRPNVRACRP